MVPHSDSLGHLSPEQQRAMLAQLLREKVENLQEIQQSFPMSAGQQGLWHAFCRDRHATPFNVYLPTRLRSVVDVGALKKAMELLSQRHSSLRTTFDERGGKLLQIVHSQLPPEFQVVDVTHLNDPNNQTPLQEFIAKETRRPFNLQSGPLLRMSVYRVAVDDYIVLATTHHIVVDFWSLILILAELRELYSGCAEARNIQLPPASNNYDQFVLEQSKMLAGEAGKQLKAYWQSQLNNAPTLLELVTDYDRPLAFTGRAAVVALAFHSTSLTQVQQIAVAARTTTFSVVHAALQVLLSRYSGQKEFLIGSPFLGRSHRKFESTVGFFVNMLPIRCNLSAQPTFVELIQATRQTLTSALEHEAYPFSSIVHDLSPPRDPGRSPLFQVSCTFEKAQLKAELGRASFLFPEDTQVMDFGGMRQESFYIPHQTCHYDLEFIFEQTDRELKGMICYCSDLFSSDSMQSMASNFVDLFHSLLLNPQHSVFDLNPPRTLTAKKSESPPASDPAGHDEENSTVGSLFDAAAVANASGIAIRTTSRQWTYGQLQRVLSSMDFQFPQKDVTFSQSPSLQDPAGQALLPVIGPATAETFIVALGALYSGAAVVPIDQDQPAIDRTSLLADTQATGIIEAPFTNIDLVGSGVQSPATKSQCASGDLAYVIYTSGTTGRPKGVMVEHRAICNTLKWRHRAVPLTSADRVLMLLSHQFDAGFGIALATLTQGAELVWGDPQSRYDFAQLIEQLIRHRITILPAIPTVLRQIIEHPKFSECRELRQFWTGGEAMPRDLPELVRQRSQATLWNFYGPTEAAVEATACEVREHDARQSVPLGYAIDGAEIIVVDESLQPVADTIPGQLAIAGVGLARGYLNLPELTAQRFVHLSNAKGQRLRVYLTGDFGRKLRNGQIEFLGRSDNQIKLRGYRIELLEIERQLETHPQVVQAAACLTAANTPQAQLVAFVTIQGNQFSQNATLLGQIRGDIASKLPAYKVPSQLFAIESMPLTTSGKIDRQKLPSVPVDDREVPYTAPSTPLEEYLESAWSNALKLAKVSVDQDFFELGGSSLQAAMLTAKLTADLGVHVPTSLLFDLADISKVARRLVQLYEIQMAEKFGMHSVTAYATRRESTTANHAEGNTLSKSLHPLIAPLKISGDRLPLFLIHPPGGIVMCYRELAVHVDRQLPIYAIRSRGLHGHERLPTSIEEAAADYIDAVKSVQPTGPYRLGGWSLGGLFALEMALQMTARGDPVERLTMLDTTIPEGCSNLVPENEQTNVGLEYGLNYSLTELRDLHPEEQLPLLWEHAKTLGVLRDETPPEVVKQVLDDLKSLFHLHMELTTRYTPRWYEGQIHLIRPKDVPFELKVSEDRGWRYLARNVAVTFVSGHHHSMVQMPHVVDLAHAIDR